jgi:hypothetical protein
MNWIDEMFADMKRDRAAASAKKSANKHKEDRAKHPKKQIPGALNAWNALVSSITVDVGDFNNHKERVGQTAVRISQRAFECEVYVPGMHGEKLVLTLDTNDLHVTVHPDFPEQQLTITIELDKEGKHIFWVLGELIPESKKLSAQELSEYLLKPIFVSADINGEP